MSNFSRLLTLLVLCISPLFASAQSDSSDATDNRPRVRFETNVGNFDIVLFSKESPITVQNFLRYVDEGFYDNTIFHRVIKRFVVQGGGFTPDMIEKPTHDPIVNESKNRLHNEKGTLSMARTDDPDSATSQFFINLRMNPRLDHSYGKAGYAVFGEIESGFEVIDFMGYQATRVVAGMADVPIEPLIVKKAYRIASK